jgi:mannose-6-phosphate isomerase-like protein (cupin superfamily)
MTVEKVEKPWGYEIIYARRSRYAGKILHVNKGESLSLQYHEKKEESIYLFSGHLLFSYGKNLETLEQKELLPGDVFHIEAGLLHRMEALETCEILEVSTPELDDVCRLEDRYGRKN